MKLIIIGNALQPARQIECRQRWIWSGLVALCFFVITFVAALWLVYDRSTKLEIVRQRLMSVEAEVFYDKSRLNNYLAYSEGLLTEQSKHAGILEAKLTRLEALGQKIAEGVGVEVEFDFTQRPSVGGPMEGGDLRLSREALEHVFGRLSYALDYRQKELAALSSVIQNTHLSRERYLAGKPIDSGWLSSRYGVRTDPFHGRPAFHKGLDFAGKEGSNVLSVALGVVIWSGDRYGFGTMVEIDHANGYITRYAHNRENTVSAGDVVRKGQVIAYMGSSGRSTGAHVHFEVLKNGRHVDPQRYIYRKAI